MAEGFSCVHPMKSTEPGSDLSHIAMFCTVFSPSPWGTETCNKLLVTPFEIVLVL